jgi:hypothetical protein
LSPWQLLQCLAMTVWTAQGIPPGLPLPCSLSVQPKARLLRAKSMDRRFISDSEAWDRPGSTKWHPGPAVITLCVALMTRHFDARVSLAASGHRFAKSVSFGRRLARRQPPVL